MPTVLERGAGHLDPVLLFGQLGQLVIDQVPSGLPFACDETLDLSQREPDLPREPVARLRELAGLLRPGGRIALVSQPRCPGATADTSSAAADELAALLTEAGFTRLRTEMLDLDPPAACVLGHTAPADDAEFDARPTARS